MNTQLPALALPDKVYFRIGEVASLLGVKTHVVRFWQQQFPTVRPERSRSGRFLYTKATVERLHLIKHLLYAEGYTIPGARKSLRARKTKVKTTAPVAPVSSANGPAKEAGTRRSQADPTGPADVTTLENTPTGRQAPATAEAQGGSAEQICALEAALATAHRQLSEADGLRAQVDALRKEEVAALRLQVAELDGLRTQVGEIAALREALADARDENQRHVTQAATACLDDGSRRADELASELAGAQATLNRAVGDSAQLRAALAARTKEVVTLNATHAKALSAQAARLAEQPGLVAEAKAAADYDVARLEAELADRVDEFAAFKNDHFEALSGAESAHKHAVASLRREHDKAMSEVVDAHEDAILLARRDHGRDLADAHQAHDAAIVTLKAEYDAEYAAQLDELRAAVAAATGTPTSDGDARAARLEQALGETLAELRVWASDGAPAKNAP